MKKSPGQSRSSGARHWVRVALGLIVTGCLALACVAEAVDSETSFPKASGPVAPLQAIGAAGPWINSPALTSQQLRGKVVLVDFWTYSCVNCLRTLPYVRAWAQRYEQAGLVVIGVHTPEFDFEKIPANVQKATEHLHIGYPVALDSDFAVWNAFGNRYWPALYLVDAQGRIRYHQYGEGQYEHSEQVIRQLLTEAGHGDQLPPALASPAGEGTQAAPGPRPAVSEETYLGYAKASGFDSHGGSALGRMHAYDGPVPTRIDHWSLTGDWTIEPELVSLARPGGRIAFRFLARDLHLVLGPARDGRPVRFRVRVDGKPPMDDHGSDVDAQGDGTVDTYRLYQLVRRGRGDRDALFEIEFLDPGVRAYVFTFG